MQNRLYEGLARLLLGELSAEDFNDLRPEGAKGEDLEVMMEILATRDPRQILLQCFGTSGLRQLVRRHRIGADAPSGIDAIESLLSHFAFVVPSPSGRKGAPQTREELHRAAARLLVAGDKAELRGPFVEACTAIESLLRLTVFGWARQLFDARADEILLSILLRSAVAGAAKIRLDRLTFGQIVGLFRELPDVIAGSDVAPFIRRKYGRTHIYTPKGKAGAADQLNSIVTERNRVEHDKDGYWSETPMAMLRDTLVSVLRNTERLISELEAVRAIPRVAVVDSEVRDRWNRTHYVLELDDGTQAKVSMSKPLRLGAEYLYFGGGANPRPVDPLLLPIERLGRIR